MTGDEARDGGGAVAGQLGMTRGALSVDALRFVRLSHGQVRAREGGHVDGLLVRRAHHLHEAGGGFLPPRDVSGGRGLRAQGERPVALQLRAGRGRLVRRGRERGHRPLVLAEPEVDRAQQLQSPRRPARRTLGLFDAGHEVGVAGAALRPGMQRLVVRRFEVLRLRRQRLGPQRVRVAAAEVEERDRAVVERGRGLAAGRRLRPRIGPSGFPLVDGDERIRRFRHRVGPALRLRREAAAQQRDHGRRYGREAVGRLFDHRFLEHLGRGRAHLPGPLAEEGLQHGQPPAPHVGAAAEGPARPLLGRHVRGRSSASARGQGRGVAAAEGHRRGRDARAGQAEVRHLGHALRGHHHVRGLHVAMDEALLVGVVQAPRELHGRVEDRVQREQAARTDRVAEGPAVHVFREDARDPFQPPHVVARHHVRMEREVHPRLGLALERFDAAGGVQRLLERDLDREVDAPAAMVDAVDAAHAALTEEARDLVQAEHDVARLPFPRAGGGWRGFDDRRHGGTGRRGRRLRQGGNGRTGLRQRRRGHGGRRTFGGGGPRRFGHGQGRRRGRDEEAHSALRAAHGPARDARGRVPRLVAARTGDAKGGGVGHQSALRRASRNSVAEE